MQPVIGAGTYVAPEAVVIGDVQLGEDSSVWPMCVLRGDVNSIRIGARTSIQDGTVIHVSHRHAARPEGANGASLPRAPRLVPVGEGHATVIGNDVTVGHRVILHGCTVEDRCLIGMGSIVLDGAVIREGTLLGAGSLVSEGKELEGGYLWLGQPARRVRVLTDAEKHALTYSAQHYVRLKNDYLNSG